MFLRSKESLRLSINSIRCIGFSNNRDYHLTHCAYLRNVQSGRRKTAEVRDSERNQSVAGEFSASAPPKRVNDNFFGIESDEGVIEIKGKSLLNNNVAGRLFQNVEKEKLVSTTFGTVRYDSENRPKLHGQLEKEKVLISSNVNKDKMHVLSRTLQKKNSVESQSVLDMEETSKTTTNTLDRNLKSKPPSSSYVDELYFPESYTKIENNTISKLENSPSSNDDKFNFIEESYFNDKIIESTLKNDNIASENFCSDKNPPPPDHDDSMETIANHKLSTFQQSMPGLKSSPSSSIDKKSNFIEESYFNDKMTDEFKNGNMASENINSIKKNQPFLFHEEPKETSVIDDKQSSFFEDYYFNTISDSNLKSSGKKNPETVAKTVDIKEKNSTNPSEVDFADTQVTSSDEKFSTENSLNDQKTNLKKHIDADDNGEQYSLELNNPILGELEGYNKFKSGVTELPKKKNNFLFQSKEFLEKNKLINSKYSSGVKKLKSHQRNVDESDTVEEIKDVIKNPPETDTSKVQIEANVKNSETNEQPETAYDFVKKLRNTKNKLALELKNGKFIQKTEQYDSKGFRILKNQVPDLKYYTRDEILDTLVKNVLYSDDDLIVLNKPYNLVMHESKTVKDPCLSQYLDDLAAELDTKTYKPKLLTVHRLDKETSGCLLLAKNEISAQRLLSLFSQRKIVKTYWIVTIKVPNPLEGVIDMPISEGSISGRARMVLHPDLPKDIPYKNHSKMGKRAVTHYKVIAESGNAALVEAKPETGIKHQIRVHFGFGLSCPILGDHKYSHLDKLAPQKLQSDLLQKLHVRQSKVRHIPMHIYARSIFIPQYKEGRNLYVMAPMPTHMSKNLQKLKFKKK